jgi:uncharacterized membrane protein
MMGGYGDGWWILMWIWMAAFWLLVLAGVVWFIWRIQRPGNDSSGAEEILKQRLARGEIDVEQYRSLAQELGASRRAPPHGPRGGTIAVILLVVLG